MSSTSDVSTATKQEQQKPAELTSATGALQVQQAQLNSTGNSNSQNDTTVVPSPQQTPAQAWWQPPPAQQMPPQPFQGYPPAHPSQHGWQPQYQVQELGYGYAAQTGPQQYWTGHAPQTQPDTMQQQFQSQWNHPYPMQQQGSSFQNVSQQGQLFQQHFPLPYPYQNGQTYLASSTDWFPPTAQLRTFPPSAGYSQAFDNTYTEARQHIDIIVKALSSANTDESALKNVLSKRYRPLDIQARLLCHQQQSQSKELIDIINDKKINFSGGYKSLVRALVCGPLELDCYILYKAVKGLGTKESDIDLVLLGRGNEDIQAIASHYERRYHEPLEKALAGDLSGDILKLYRAVLRAERRWEDPNMPIPQQELKANLNELYAALTGKVDVDKLIKFFVIGSEHRLKAIIENWTSGTGDSESLKQRIVKQCHGHLESALSYIISCVTDRPSCDAQGLEQSLHNQVLKNSDDMAIRIVKILWENAARGNRDEYLRKVDKYFRSQGHRKSLLNEIKANSNGHMKDLLLAIFNQYNFLNEK